MTDTASEALREMQEMLKSVPNTASFNDREIGHLKNAQEWTRLVDEGWVEYRDNLYFITFKGKIALEMYAEQHPTMWESKTLRQSIVDTYALGRADAELDAHFNDRWQSNGIYQFGDTERDVVLTRQKRAAQ